MTTNDIDTWTAVCDESAIAPGEAFVLAVDPPVAVWNVEGELLSTDDTCTHEDFSLAESYIDGCQVECALHWAKFDLRTGEALSQPACVPLRTYPVRVTDGTVLVDLSGRDT